MNTSRTLTRTVMTVFAALCISLCTTTAMANWKTVDLVAAKNIVIGEITVGFGIDTLYITYKITDPDWVLLDTHLAVTDDIADIPRTKKGNPIPGHFQYCTEHEPTITEYTYEIDPFFPVFLEPPLFIAAHAKVQNVDGDVEGAWGEGYQFSQKRGWAMYFWWFV